MKLIHYLLKSLYNGFTTLSSVGCRKVSMTGIIAAEGSPISFSFVATVASHSQGGPETPFFLLPASMPHRSKFENSGRSQWACLTASMPHLSKCPFSGNKKKGVSGPPLVRIKHGLH